VARHPAPTFSNGGLGHVSGVGGDPTRRAFLGSAAGAAGAVVAAGAVGSAVTGCTASSGKSSPKPSATEIRIRSTKSENSLPGEPHWRIRHLGKPHEIEGFSGEASVRQGDPVTLYVSTTAREFRVSVLRMGWYKGLLARQVWQSGWLRGHRQNQPATSGPTRTVSCDWDPVLTMQTGEWPEGTYLLRLDASSGAQRYVPVTVRSFSTAGKVVLKNAVATWQAYNGWGGYSLAAGPAGYDNRSLAVSMDRPYDGTGADGFLRFERKLISVAERLGVPLAYTTSVDLDRDSHALGGATALISMGRDEYWSPAERRHVTAGRNIGLNVAFFGSMAMVKRIRLAASKVGADRLVICYQTSYRRDPMYGKHDALVTSDWREPPHPDPESSLTGTSFEAAPVSADYVVVAPDSWLFHDTGARLGTRVRGLVGDAYDRVNPAYPVPRPIEILSHSPVTCRATRSYSDSAYYTHGNGAGVFNTGTTRWVQSLGPYGGKLAGNSAAFTSQVTVNVLQAFAQGPAGIRHSASDNLAAMDEWPGDPVAAGHNLWPPVVR
jgi:N,N-dimethylformamidase beta subunit-like, C-terminal